MPKPMRPQEYVGFVESLKLRPDRSALMREILTLTAAIGLPVLILMSAVELKQLTVIALVALWAWFCGKEG